MARRSSSGSSPMALRDLVGHREVPDFVLQVVVRRRPCAAASRASRWRRELEERTASTARPCAWASRNERSEPRAGSKRSGWFHSRRKTSWVTSSASVGLLQDPLGQAEHGPPVPPVAPRPVPPRCSGRWRSPAGRRSLRRSAACRTCSEPPSQLDVPNFAHPGVACAPNSRRYANHHRLLQDPGGPPGPRGHRLRRLQGPAAAARRAALAALHARRRAPHRVLPARPPADPGPPGPRHHLLPLLLGVRGDVARRGHRPGARGPRRGGGCAAHRRAAPRSPAPPGGHARSAPSPRPPSRAGPSSPCT